MEEVLHCVEQKTKTSCVGTTNLSDLFHSVFARLSSCSNLLWHLVSPAAAAAQVGKGGVEDGGAPVKWMIRLDQRRRSGSIKGEPLSAENSGRFVPQGAYCPF